MDTTTATINGAKIELGFGALYALRYGRAETVLRSAELVERKANGDLVFVQRGQDGAIAHRVRPSTIDHILVSTPVAEAEHPSLAAELAAQAEVDRLVENIVGDGDRDPDSVAAKVESELRARSESIASPRADDETAAEYLARIERLLGAMYVRWIETGPGQDALAAADREAKAARKVVPIRRDQPTQVVVAGTVVAETRRIEPKLGKAGRAKLEAVGIPTAWSETADEAIRKARAGKPYAERTQVWRCSECKRRTRVPECSGPKDAPHAPVSAPAGKRREDRS